MEYKKLSKKISYALRHSPESFGLVMDAKGFVDIDALLRGLNELQVFERDITRHDIEYIMKIMEKKRFEIVGDRIRAFYGHSIDSVVEHVEKIPPKILYHGTAHKFEQSIKEKGLLPMNRQFVHLSEDIETAVSVGKRRDKKPLIYSIDTEKAMEKGIKFYIGNEDVWLTAKVPPELLVEVGDDNGEKDSREA